MITQEQETERAKQMVERFVRRFQPSYRLLAYHAALPLVLTPELLNFLRVQFLQGEVPWVAEVDLLLSDLCSQVGYELYAMNTAVRAYLVDEMQRNSSPNLGKERMQEVASLLISYVKYLSQSNPYISSKELETQQWAAMVYLGDEHCKAVARDIAENLIEVTSNAGGELTESAIRAELARLTQITEKLSPQLQQQPTLLEYARLIQQILRTPEEVETEQLNRSYQVENLELQFPDRLLPEKLASTVQSSRQKITNLKGFPSLQNFDFRIAAISLEEETKTPADINLQPFEYEVATIELKKSGTSRKNTELIINRRRQQSQYFTEDLGNGIELEMVKIPGGTFTMGTPKDEEGSKDNEHPQHQVTVPSFFMGKYPITQAQWRAVANMQHLRANRDLKPEPSRFKGDNLPVEYVSWYDAVEFCNRLNSIVEDNLSQDTVKQYRLPSEAEWEYACRAATTTPFHFGETITSDLANYNASSTYGAGSRGIYREKTTRVDSFDVANAFGLYDMHGNVWEWCLDNWHDNYEGAPTDGSAWVDTEHQKDNDNRYQLLRGGSWFSFPAKCRSASRNGFSSRDYGNNVIGFRVACAVGRIL